MGYDISLREPVSGEVVQLDAPFQIRGSTYAIGGPRYAELSVTYNYSGFYYRDDVFGEKGIRTIYGMTGAESIPVIKKAMAALKDDVDPNYWEPTEGNAKKALAGLLAFAQLRPDGIWEGD